jgi:SAM-dependent methyltransferase
MTQHEDLPFSAAADRNKGPILEVLERVLPASARVLEIASGTGQHAAHFASVHAGWTWQPTDAEASSLPAIARRCEGLANVRPPLQFDVLAWPEAVGRGFDAVYCANMLHISPWPTCAALMRGASNCLRAAGALVLYGPFLVDGEATASGNLAFDADLRARNRAWGIRRLADVAQEAARFGLTLEQRVSMPANNLTLAFRAPPAPR